MHWAILGDVLCYGSPRPGDNKLKGYTANVEIMEELLELLTSTFKIFEIDFKSSY